jgi:hypothetical protein
MSDHSPAHYHVNGGGVPCRDCHTPGSADARTVTTYRQPSLERECDMMSGAGLCVLLLGHAGPHLWPDGLTSDYYADKHRRDT